VGGRHLDRRVAAEHHEIRRRLRTLDGRGFLDALAEVLAAYSPPANQAHLNVLGSHDTPRLRTLLGGDTLAVRLAMLLQMALPGAPCIYYGDEVGLEGRIDPGCRGAFPWNPAAWDEELRTFARAAIVLRTAEPALRSTNIEPLVAAAGACAFLRGDRDRSLVVAVNAGGRAAELSLGGHGFTSAPDVLLKVGPTPELRSGEDGSVGLRMAPRSGVVLRA
jgi:glycosidase